MYAVLNVLNLDLTDKFKIAVNNSIIHWNWKLRSEFSKHKDNILHQQNLEITSQTQANIVYFHTLFKYILCQVRKNKQTQRFMKPSNLKDNGYETCYLYYLQMKMCIKI